MIVDIQILRKEKDLKELLEEVDDSTLKSKLRAIEKAIRKNTNNKFLDTQIRCYGEIQDNKIIVQAMPYLKVGDNIQLSHTLNDDVYTIIKIDENFIVVDAQLYDCKKCMITKVFYPEDIQEGVINMIRWDFTLRNKVGIKSETISRHSVTYFDMNKDNSLNGYPIALLGFLDSYRKARF